MEKINSDETTSLFGNELKILNAEWEKCVNKCEEYKKIINSSDNEVEVETNVHLLINQVIDQLKKLKTFSNKIEEVKSCIVLKALNMKQG